MVQFLEDQIKKMFVHPGWPWFLRGSGYSRGIGSDVFSFANDYGRAHAGVNFRVLLCYDEINLFLKINIMIEIQFPFFMEKHINK